MRIGLLTYHKSYNCGAVLQTYATCRLLKELGHEVELIDLRQPEPIKLRQLIFIPRFIKFHRFCKKFYPSLTRHYKTVEELRKAKLDYDCLLVGSDQTWNPLILTNTFRADWMRRQSFCCGTLTWWRPALPDLPSASSLILF